jgi:hydantoinase/carbamoylase family amidase
VTVSITADLEQAARFGGEGTGVTRYAWSPELQAASEWLVDRLTELGLEAEFDPAGNVIGRWEAGAGTAVLVGSHLDTVPRGGRYDGALGVLAALDAIRSLRRKGVEPSRPVWLASFMDEEGSRFRTGLLGSRAFVGEDLSGLDARVGADGVSLREAMAALGFDFGRIREARAVERVGAYLELHIEQGPRLERAGIDVGIVTAIVGLVSYRTRFTGEANHAGTTPMDVRRDALAGAARAVLALRDEARARDDMTANVGIIDVKPGGFNVIPGECQFTIDVRSPSPEGFARVQRFVHETIERIASEERLGFELEETHRLDPSPMDAGLVDTLERAAELEGASSLRLVSGAGHDAMTLARHVPAAMLFVPSRDGISHSPEEFTEPRFCELGARVLGRAVELLVAPAPRSA